MRGALAIAAAGLVLAVGACGGGDDKRDVAAATTVPRAATTTFHSLRTTTTQALDGPVPTAATCPTAGEMGAIVKTPPTTLMPSPSTTSVNCHYIWDPSPASTLDVYIGRWTTAASLATFFAKDMKDDQDEAAGKTHTAHKTGPGSVTAIQGLGDEAYVHYEKPLDYHDGPGTYEIETRSGSLYVAITMRDSDALRFGPGSGDTAQGVEIAKFAFKKAA